MSSYKLDVTYTNGSIIGPLSFGLSSLPTSVTATFMLGPGQPTTTGDNLAFNQTDVSSANITFGDGTWTASALGNFSMSVVSGVIRSLTYNFLPINTQLVKEGIVLNFPLMVTGTDRASGDSFEYQYTASTQTLEAIPEPGTFLLLGSGLLGLMGWQWAKKNRVMNTPPG